MSATEAALSSLLPLVLGGAFQFFSAFLENETDFENRERQVCAKSKELLASSLQRLIREALRIDGFDNMPRGDGVSSPDLYGDVVEMVARHTLIAIRSERRLLQSACCHWLFFAGCVVGVLALLTSLAASRFSAPASLYEVLMWVCFAVVVVQVASAVHLRTIIGRSKNDEKVV